MTNKCRKFETLKPFGVLSHTGLWKDFCRNTQHWKWMCYRIEKYTVHRRVCASLTQEILQAEAVKGLKKRGMLRSAQMTWETVTVTTQKEMLRRLNEPSAQRGRRHRYGTQMWCGRGYGRWWGQAHGADKEQLCGNHTYGLWCFCVVPF